MANKLLSASAAGLIVLAGCTADPQSPVPAAPAAAPSAVPSPQQVFLDAAHAGQWPLPDARLLTLSRSLCNVLNDPTSQPGIGTQQAGLLKLSEHFTQDQATGFVYEAERAFCPDKIGQ